MQTAELFNFAKWLMLSLMVELCKRMSAEIQGSNKCQVNSNYPTNIWHFRYFSCERDSNFRRFSDFKKVEILKMHNNKGFGLDIDLSF